ncbi:MAG: hypothetical protein ACXVB9_17485 [Bdellovibrionota bacterium]
MKYGLVLAIALVSGSAFAGGPTRGDIDSREMSCSAVQQAVQADGAVILHYGDDLYDRVVSTQSFCDSAAGETTQPYYAPTQDNAECFAGYLCVNQGGGY